MIPIQLDKHMYEVGHHVIMHQNESLHKVYLVKIKIKKKSLSQNGP